MSKFINSVVRPSVRKWMNSELVVAPIAFCSVLAIYLSVHSVFSAFSA